MHKLASILLFFCLLPCSALASELPGPSFRELNKAGDILHKNMPESVSISPSNPYTQNQILVRFKDKVSANDIAAAHAKMSASIVRKYNIVKNLQLVKLTPGMSVMDAIELYSANDNVFYAEPNYKVHALMIPNDPFFDSLWSLLNTGQNGGIPNADINVAPVWDLTTGNNNIVVVVIDTGIDYAHQDLAVNMWKNIADCNDNGSDDDGNGYIDDCYGVDTINNDSDPLDDNGHGTHVAGIIGSKGNNGIGTTGVNWNISLMACKCLDKYGEGSVAEAVDCLEYVKAMRDRGVNVIATNNSWGGTGFSQALHDAIDVHRKAGILFIAASGNFSSDNDAYPDFPASFYIPNIISVAATDETDDIAFFSNDGRQSVHIGAPGHDILSTTIGNSFLRLSGTSMAAPQVAGVAALMKAQEQGRDWISIKNLIIAGGESIPSLENTISQKRLDAYGAITCFNSVILSRLKPAGRAIHARVGKTIDLSVLHINCAAPNGQVSVTVNPGGQKIMLLDDGLGSDQVAGDGIYSAQWTPSTEGIFTLDFPNGDVVAVKVFLDQNPPLFSEFTFRYLGMTFAQAIAIGDVNDDGRNDVVVTTSNYYDPENDQRIHVFHQSLSGELSEPVKYLVGEYGTYSQITSVDIGDLNNDGRADVAVCSMNAESPQDNFVGVFLQNDQGALGPMIRYLTPNSQRLKIGDVNNDGLPDIVSIGCNTTSIDVFLQNRQGSLSAPVVYGVMHGCDSQVELGDINDDGLPDIVIINGIFSGGPNLAVMSQKKDGTFAPPVYYDYRGEQGTGGVAVGDINGDGLNDIVVTFFGMPFIGTFLQTDSNTFGTPINYPSFVLPLAVKIRDINGDGLNDVIVLNEAHGGSDLQIYLQAPNGFLFPFLTHQIPFEDFNPQGMAVGDINGDGAADIVSADANYGLSIVYNDLQADPIVLSLNILKGLYGDGTVISSPGGIICGADCQGQFNEGTYVTLTAVPNADSIFAGWRGRDCKEEVDGSCTVIMYRNSAVQANFDLISATLMVTKIGTGNGTVISNPPGLLCTRERCSGVYDAHTKVSLTAVPDEDSVFDGWYLDCWGLLCSLTLNNNKTVHVAFNKKKGTITVQKSGSGGGIIKSSPNGINCGFDCSQDFAYGTSVTLTPVPDHGSTFVGWSGGGCSGLGECVLTLSSDVIITAEFSLPNPDLSGEWLSLSKTCKNNKKGIKCKIKGKFSVMNIGNRNSQASVVNFYLSDNETFDAEDIFLKQVSLGKLRAGKTTLKTLSKDFPYDFSVSGKYIIAVIDFYNNIIEMNENNNILVYGLIP